MDWICLSMSMNNGVGMNGDAGVFSMMGAMHQPLKPSDCINGYTFVVMQYPGGPIIATEVVMQYEWKMKTVQHWTNGDTRTTTTLRLTLHLFSPDSPDGRIQIMNIENSANKLFIISSNPATIHYYHYRSLQDAQAQAHAYATNHVAVVI